MLDAQRNLLNRLQALLTMVELVQQTILSTYMFLGPIIDKQQHFMLAYEFHVFLSHSQFLFS